MVWIYSSVPRIFSFVSQNKYFIQFVERKVSAFSYPFLTMEFFPASLGPGTDVNSELHQVNSVSHKMLVIVMERDKVQR
jgi:hypothetical protein